MTRKIGFIGVHNGGKDTLSHYLFTQLKMKGKTAYYIPEIAEKAIMHGMKLNEPNSQMYMLGEQIARETEAEYCGKREYIVCNRTVIDVLPYGAILKNYFEMREIVANYLHSNPYYMIFRVKPFSSIEDDGVRLIDQTRQHIIDNLFDSVLNDLRVSGIELGQPTKEERMKVIDRLVEALI